MTKENCRCGKMAVWLYMPGFSDKTKSDYFCEDCVNRGCDCNHRYVNRMDVDYDPPFDISRTSEPDLPAPDESFKWIEDGKIWVSVDEKGREYPCCEYDYEENGFDCE